MFSTVAAPSPNPLAFVPHTPCCRGEGSHQPGPVDATSSDPSDVLSLSQPGTLSADDAYTQQTSLRLRTRSQIIATDDGQTLAMSHTKLRFRYDFEAADGTKICVRLQANLHVAQLTDEDAETQSTKLRASIRFSVLQEDVSSGVAPLLESPNTSADALDSIAQALEAFQQVTDAAASLFLESNPLDGDSLITGMVDAFNELSEAIRSAFLPSADAGEAASSLEAPTLPAPPATTAPRVVAAEPVVDTATTPPATSTSNEPAVTEIAAPPETGESQGITPATTEPSQTVVGSVMLRLRVQVVESLRSLVDAFDADSSDQSTSRSALRISAQYSARYQFAATSLVHPLLSGDRIDAQV